MVLLFKIKNNFILLEAFALVFTVSMYFTDNPRMYVDGCGVIVYFS